MSGFCFPPTSSFLSGSSNGCQQTCELRSAQHQTLFSGRRGPQFFGAPLLTDISTFRKVRSHSPCCMSIKTARNSPLKIAVLISGGGRSLENICERIEAGTLTGCEISVVIASKKSAGGIQRAERFGIPTRVLRMRDFDNNTELFSCKVSNLLDEFSVDLVVLAGWMHFYLIPPRYEGKVINIHPSLIPAFCGKGYYGQRVHDAVVSALNIRFPLPLSFGVKITGCTVHLADNKYDHGPIILQKSVPVLDTDNADDLASRVFESEKEALPESIQLFADGRLDIEGRHVRIRPISVKSEL